jgi:hypothetical protein
MSSCEELVIIAFLVRCIFVVFRINLYIVRVCFIWRDGVGKSWEEELRSKKEWKNPYHRSIFPSLVIFIFLFSNLNELIHILLLYYSSNHWLNELFFNSSTLLSMHPSSYPYIDVLRIYILLEDMYLFLEQSLKLRWWSTTLLWWHTTNCNSIHKWCGIQSSY